MELGCNGPATFGGSTELGGTPLYWATENRWATSPEIIHPTRLTQTRCDAADMIDESEQPSFRHATNLLIVPTVTTVPRGLPFHQRAVESRWTRFSAPEPDESKADVKVASTAPRWLYLPAARETRNPRR